jgi:hypothetical protein
VINSQQVTTLTATDADFASSEWFKYTILIYRFQSWQTVQQLLLLSLIQPLRTILALLSLHWHFNSNWCFNNHTSFYWSHYNYLRCWQLHRNHCRVCTNYDYRIGWSWYNRPCPIWYRYLYNSNDPELCSDNICTVVSRTDSDTSTYTTTVNVTLSDVVPTTLANTTDDLLYTWQETTMFYDNVLEAIYSATIN